MWSSGDGVLLRYVDAGRISRVLPMTVVADDEEATQLFIPTGTRTRTRCHLDGTPISRALPYAERWARPWILGEGAWGGFNMLSLTPAGAAHSAWVLWDRAWRFVEWYINLQEPLRRTRFGFDTADHVLDLEIAPDLTWRWKDEDEDELEDAIRAGRFTQGEAAELYAEGKRVVAASEARAWPFDRDWSQWRPDPAWPTPTFVEGCDAL